MKSADEFQITNGLTPCCNYKFDTDNFPVKWNPFNLVVQCHNCGQVWWSQKPTDQLDAYRAGMKRAAEIAGPEDCYPDCHSDYCMGRQGAKEDILIAADALKEIPKEIKS